MARRRGRGLRGEEEALWSAVARTTRPLRPVVEVEALPPAPVRTPVPALAPRPEPVLRILAPQPPPRPALTWAPPQEPVTRLGPATPGLDGRTAERLRKGRLEPEARIDLHGHTLDAAHGVLNGFIFRSQARGLRCVLVITGKGRRFETEPFFGPRNGVLRDSVPRWLTLPPLGPLVVGVYPAHAKHGGGGAFYVYLRRTR